MAVRRRTAPWVVTTELLPFSALTPSPIRVGLRKPDRRTDTERTLTEVSRAGDLTGYEPTTDIREGVARFVEWYRENRDWYEPLIRSS